MPLIETKGAASAQGFGLTLGGAQPVYIEDVFSTYLYTGNGANRSINNGIDLSTKGGLEWLKVRTGGTYTHYLFDTSRGPLNYLSTTTNAGQFSLSGSLTAFNTNGFSLGGTQQGINGSFLEYVSWTFRKQPKFFDVVTYTGNGANGRAISHSLGSSPGFVIIKRTDSTGSWWCWHSSFSAATDYIRLNTTETVNALGTLTDLYQGVSSTTVTVGTNSAVNGNGMSYVMYVFASNAGGFGLTGTDNVISCGSFTKSSGVVASITLGYEPQWLLFKRTDAAENWFMIDNMRGMPSGSADAYLIPNLSNAEGNLDFVTPTATGFEATNNFNNGTYIYIAIRRGPMKTPTSGTSVFAVDNTPVNGSTTTPCYDSGFPVDLGIRNRTTGASHFFVDRLRGSNYLLSDSTAAEADGSPNTVVNGYQQGFYGYSSESTVSGVGWMFRRAPSFFDEVCYTGDATTPRTINHNLGVAPELIITKQRDTARSWPVRITALGNSVRAFLNLTDAAAASASAWPVATYTSSTYVIGSDASVNASGGTYVAYLFASCPGVSKVGSYTGTGTTKQIDCGFTGGARFVLIKRTDSTGDWYVWDSARGIVAGNDPYLLLNSTAAEVTTTDYIDTYSAGFEISSTAPAAINASGGTFIYLAIA